MIRREDWGARLRYDDEWLVGEVRNGWPHNVVAHPLLAIWPRLGEAIHDMTRPTVPTWRARWRRWRR